jgi:hypothetical protein
MQNVIDFMLICSCTMYVYVGTGAINSFAGAFGFLRKLLVLAKQALAQNTTEMLHKFKVCMAK